MDSNSSLWRRIDWFTLGLYLLLVVLGCFCIYAAGYNFEEVDIFDLNARIGKQVLWIGVSLITGFILLLIDEEFFKVLAWFFYVAMILLLIATIFLARDIKGSRSWIDLGGMSVQPAELAKFTTTIALASFMNAYNFTLLTWRNSVIAAATIFTPMLIIILQKETGSALVFTSFLLVLYREGMTGMILFTGVSAVIIFILTIKFGTVLIFDEMSALGEIAVILFTIIACIVLLWMYQPSRLKIRLKLVYLALLFTTLTAFAVLTDMLFEYSYLGYGCIALMAVVLFYYAFVDRVRDYFLIGSFIIGCIAFHLSVDYIFDNVLKPHQQIRIEVLLGLAEDPTGAGYNVNQSKIAIGSGGLWGKGFLNGTQTKLKYVPEQDTDFIFCTIGEEFGFFGTSFVILLFVTLILRLIFLAERQHTTYGRVFGYSVASILLFHLTINVGMVIGLLPVIGIPLPFFSYGGSSLWAFSILVFSFIKVNAESQKKMIR